MKLIMCGNAVDGFTFFGPVEDADIESAADELSGDWWVVYVEPVEELYR